jgi:Helix-turn-helix domain
LYYISFEKSGLVSGQRGRWHFGFGPEGRYSDSMLSAFAWRPSESEYIERVWRARLTGQGTMRLAAKGYWDIIIERQSGRPASVIFNGPASRARAIDYYELGTEYVGIALKTGVFLPDMPAAAVMDDMRVLPLASPTTFWLEGYRLALPGFATAEEFVAKLVRSALLSYDAVVGTAAQGRPPGLSQRSVQRHFANIVGLTPNYLQQIARAHQAEQLLQRGQRAAAVASDLGYTDHAHLTKSLKRILGQTPSSIN